VLRAGGRAITADPFVVEESEAAEKPVSDKFERLLELQFHESIQAWERLPIDRALQASNGNKAEAA
jgi:hypothetical protein